MVAVALFLLATPQVKKPSAQKPLVLNYTIISNGALVGQETNTFLGQTMDTSYDYNDRGRGPKVTGHYDLDKDGFLSRVLLKGVDYYKATVDEHFWMNEKQGNWKSTAEQGHGNKGGFYLSLNGPTGELGLLASVLLHEKHSIPLYPGGEASIEKVQDTTLTLHGKTKHVNQYAISGLNFAPQMVWLDDDNRFFAIPDNWHAVIRKGWEEANPLLIKLQTASVDRWYSQVAKSISNNPKYPVVFRHVRVFDSENATTKENQDVLVRGDKIEKVGDADSFEIPSDSEQIDGTGQTLLPGLFDMHTHNQPGDGLLDISCGVTSVRDMGNNIDDLGAMQKHWDSGDQVGPRVNKAGLIDGTGPYQCPTGLYASTQEEALADVNKYVDNGYIQIKLYSSLNPAYLPAMIKLAHEKGLRVSGHVPQGLFASEFVGLGADEIQHMNFVMLNFMRDKVKDTRTPERFVAVAKYGASIDLNSQTVKDFIDLLLTHHTTLDVTMVTFEPMFTARPGVCDPSMVQILDRMPAQVQRYAFSGGLETNKETDQLYKSSFDAMMRMLGKLYAAGVPILAGTDSMAGFMLHRELELEVKAGIPAPKALQIATWNAASLMKQQDSLGSIAAGKTADLYMVEGNPAVNISDIRRSRMVMKNGVLFHCDQVCAAAGIKAAK